MHYQAIKENIADIAKKCGRDPNEITLVAISKGIGWEEMQLAYANGCRDFGENRLAEAESKTAKGPSDIQWHFIGTLQKNKVRKVVERFDLIHSIDSLELAKKISHVSEEIGVPMRIFLEANTSGESSKHGATPDEWKRNYEILSKLPFLEVEGLMTMAPLVSDEQVIRQCFAELRKLCNELRLKHLSMGMSHDYPIAIEEGATFLRIGTKIFRGAEDSER